MEKVEVYDLYSSLAPIILNALIEFNETRFSAAAVDDEDVPENLKSTSAPPKENKWDTDENWFARWDYVLNEMIFAFQSIVDDTESMYHDDYWEGEMDVYFEPIGDGEFCEFKKGPNHTQTFLEEKYDKINARIQNGLMLFGKYYRNLWI